VRKKYTAPSSFADRPASEEVSSKKGVELWAKFSGDGDQTRLSAWTNHADEGKIK
jgi:hypothetical protein